MVDCACVRARVRTPLLCEYILASTPNFRDLFEGSDLVEVGTSLARTRVGACCILMIGVRSTGVCVSVSAGESVQTDL